MKVLILTAKFGMGHLSASNSIRQDILKFDRNADIKVIDLFEYSMPALSGYIYKGFNLIVKYAKNLYGSYYSANDKKIESKDLITRKFAADCEKLFEEEKPDIVVSTFPVVSQGVSYYKEKTSSKVALITCITDVSSHYEWIADHTNKYMVPCLESKKGLIEKGVTEDKIVVYGIPVSEKFKENYYSLSHPAVAEKNSKILEMSNYRRKKELLIMGGGLGVLPDNREFYEKLNELDGVHTTIVAGNNKDLYNILYNNYENITVLAYTDRVSELMQDADCVVTKPGGITMFEAIYSLTPIVSFSTKLPNELKNIDFIQDNNLGIVLNESAEKSIERIVRFVNNDKRTDEVRKSMNTFVQSLDSRYFDEYVSDLQLIDKKIDNL
ncbi:galactosyldiacylglycerol synthase [Peptostreptococcus russellii]|uniref:Galactosyldiacylglycerol synthase n=1 Tax=Peptostreptococcus russellii TaxID=215200 RepID=A0A2P7Q259_9FIRM|nr:glycosyltransferase [Peptostreptococcus russellii]PSJ32042.1 galactosyldiacylglycerol synthase [Peptostreptococcus russellii]